MEGEKKWCGTGIIMPNTGHDSAEEVEPAEGHKEIALEEWIEYEDRI